MKHNVHYYAQITSRETLVRQIAVARWYMRRRGFPMSSWSWQCDPLPSGGQFQLYVEAPC